MSVDFPTLGYPRIVMYPALWAIKICLNLEMQQSNCIFAARITNLPRYKQQRYENISRGGAEVARWAHNPKVIGSNPIPATTEPWHESAGVFLFPTRPQSLLCRPRRKKKKTGRAQRARVLVLCLPQHGSTQFILSPQLSESQTIIWLSSLW